MASKLVLPVLAGAVVAVSFSAALYTSLKQAHEKLEDQRDAEEVERLQEEGRRRHKKAEAAAAEIHAARRNPVKAGPPPDSVLQRADALVLAVVRQLGEALCVREHTQMPFTHLPILGGPCTPNFAMLCASILLGTTWSHDARCLTSGLLDVDQAWLSLRSLDAEAAALVVAALQGLATRPFLGMMVHAQEPAWTPLPVGHLGKPACAACEGRTFGRASYVRFLVAAATNELAATAVNGNKCIARMYPVTFHVQGAAQETTCKLCWAPFSDIVPAELAVDTFKQLRALGSTLGLCVVHTSQFGRTADTHAVRGQFAPQRQFDFARENLLIAANDVVKHGFIAGATRAGDSMQYTYDHGNIRPLVAFRSNRGNQWVPPPTLAPAVIVDTINEITATMLLQRRAQLLLQRVSVPLLTGASLEHIAALTGDAGMVGGDGIFDSTAFARLDRVLLTQVDSADCAVRKGLVQAIREQFATPDVGDALKLEAEVDTFVLDLLHVMRTRANMTPVNAQRRTPLQVAGPVSLAHLAMRSILVGEGAVYPHTSRALAHRLSALAAARDAHTAASCKAPMRAIHAALAALLLYALAALVLSWLFAASSLDFLLWLVTSCLPASLQLAVMHAATYPPVRTALVAASGALCFYPFVGALPLLLQTQLSSFATLAGFARMVDAQYRRWVDPLLLTHAECAALEAACTAQMRVWGMRRLTADLRRAAAAPAITLDDMLLLLDEMVELTAGAGETPAASPAAASSRVLPPGMTTVRVGNIDVLIPESVGAVDRTQHDVVLESGELACSDEASQLITQLLEKPVLEGSGAGSSVLSSQLRAAAGTGGLTQRLAVVLDGRTDADDGGQPLLGDGPAPRVEPAYDDAGEPRRRPRFMRHSLYQHARERPRREEAPASQQKQQQQRRHASRAEWASLPQHTTSTHADAAPEPHAGATRRPPLQPHHGSVKEALEANGFYLLRNNKHYFYQRIVVGERVRQTATVSRTPSTHRTLATITSLIRRANEQQAALQEPPPLKQE